MKKYNTVIVTQVRNLEEDDLFAWELLGSVIGAKVVGLRYYAYQLTDEEKAYMAVHNLELNGDECEVLGGNTQVLCFFMEQYAIGSGVESKLNHAFLNTDRVIAVFPNSRPGVS